MAGRSSVTDAAARRSNPWIVLAALLLIYIVNFADRYLISGLVGPMKAEFGLGDGFMGLLMGPAFVVLYVVMGVPIARFSDHSSRIRIVVAGCIVWSLATITTGFATGPVSLALSRVAVGVGEAAFVAPAYSLLADYFKPERRGLAFAILGLATYFGQIAGQGGGPLIGEIYGWRWAFWSMGLIGVFLALVALVLVREPARETDGPAHAPSAVPKAQIPFGEMLRFLRASPGYLYMLGAFTFAAISGVAFGSWGPELFARSYGLDPVTAKGAFALHFGGAGLVGILLFGAFSDRMSRRGMEWPVRLAAFAIAAATALILIVTWLDSFTAAKWLSIPCGLLGGGWSVGMLATLQYILPARFRASATAVFIAVTTLGAQLIGPFLAGMISQSLGDDALSLRTGLTVVMPLGFIGAVSAWLAIRHIESDRQGLMAASARQGAAQ